MKCIKCFILLLTLQKQPLKGSTRFDTVGYKVTDDNLVGKIGHSLLKCDADLGKSSLADKATALFYV